MDDFLKKRLENHTPAEDGWNIPSDDLWNKAKPHFPKKKKKKRWPFAMLIFGTLLLSGVGLYIANNSFRYQKMETTNSAAKLEGTTEKQLPTTTNEANDPNN